MKSWLPVPGAPRPYILVWALNLFLSSMQTQINAVHYEKNKGCGNSIPCAKGPEAEYCCHSTKQWALTRELVFGVDMGDTVECHLKVLEMSTLQNTCHILGLVCVQAIVFT